MAVMKMLVISMLMIHPLISRPLMRRPKQQWTRVHLPVNLSVVLVPAITGLVFGRAMTKSSTMATTEAANVVMSNVWDGVEATKDKLIVF
mgnify:CR=1 FL=1